MLLSVSLQASDAILSASSQREADRSFAAYTNNELRVVATTVDEWDDSNPYKIVDRLPANMPFHLVVGGRSTDALAADDAIATVTTSMPAHVRAYFEHYKVMGPMLNWILRRSRAGATDEKAYLEPATHRAVWRAKDFDLAAIARVAGGISSNHVPMVTTVMPVYQEFAKSPITPAEPLVDYPDPRPEQTFATPCGIGIVLRAVEARRKFRFRALAGRPGDPKVNYKWVVMSTSGSTFGVTVSAMNGLSREFSPEKGFADVVLDWPRLGSRVDVAVFARYDKGPYGPPSVVSFYKVPNERRTYDRAGRISRVEYAKADFAIPELFQNKSWTDDYVIGDFGNVVGFVRRRNGQASNPERFSATGEYVVEEHPSGLPKVARRVRYFTPESDASRLDYEITTSSVTYPLQAFEPRTRGEFPLPRRRR